MRHLLNTLFVTSEDIYLSLDGENVVASREKGPVSPSHPVCHSHVFLSRCFSRPNGSLCPARDLPVLLYAPGKILGPSHR